MIMKKILIILILSFPFTIVLVAQNSEDAFRYSSYSNTGSSRFIGLSGAMGSIGGDLTSLNYNPAGLGIYKSSEYVFAPRYLYNSVESNYNGYTRTDSRDNLNFGMIGMVTSMPLINRLNPNAPGWKYVQFGFSINRVDNYRSNIFIEGNSYGGSKVYDWQNDANGNYPDDLNVFGSNLAWETYLLDTVNGYSNNYITAVPANGVYQSYYSYTEGYKNEMSFAFSGNYNNRLFVGTSMSFSFLRYYRNTFLTEEAIENPAANEFDYFTYREELSTRGNGFNAKFGVIYMVSPALRINAAFHTPTWFYRMNDYYYTRVDSKMANGDKYYQTSPNGSYDYELTTPLRAMGGLSYFIANRGFISVDYEYMDYGTSKLKDYSNSFASENQDIKETFTSTHSLRLGGELRLQPFTLRAGYGISSSAIQSDINELFSSQYSFGFGYRSGAFAFDFSFMQKQNSQNYYMYNADFVNPAYLISHTNYFSATVGFKF